MRKWKFEEVSLEVIQPAKENANQMSKKDFEQLVSNIRKSGGLSSAITCYKKQNGSFVLISGHHRVEACKKLGYHTIPCVYADEEDISNDEKIALQLSHNSLHGEDDKGILKRLFDEISNVDYKQFAHIDVNEIKAVDIDSFSFTPESEHYSISVILYKNEKRLMDELLGVIDEATKSSDCVIVADQSDTENELLNLLGELRKQYGIKSSNIAFAKIIELAHKQMKYDSICND